MGILNVTRDSFSDGGMFVDPERALERAMQMIGEGADILDIGAESTRPGANPVETEIQIAALVPLVGEIRRQNGAIPISVDTRSAAVARAAIDSGADIVNDVSAGGDDPDMFHVVAETGAGLVLMHMMGRPETGFADPRTGLAHEYGDIIQEIREFLVERIRAAERHGVNAGQLAIDPGFGFGKDTRNNLELLARCGTLRASLNFPLLIGLSRKRFIGAVLDQPNPADRLYGSLAGAAVAVMCGANIIRTHDVGPTAQVVRMCEAIRVTAGTSPLGMK